MMSLAMMSLAMMSLAMTEAVDRRTRVQRP
jgi:hypothetical protein